MQSNPAMQPEPPLSRSRQGRLGLIKGLFFGGTLIFMASLLIVYLAWDYMPARVQYIPRYVQSHFLPARAHPASVPTPVAAVAPEDALASLDLDSSPEEESALTGSATEDEAKEANQEAETASSQAETANQEAETVSDEAPEESEMVSDEAKTEPEESEMVSDEAKTEPEESETVSDEVPEEAETAPDEAETVPQEAETVPEEAETVPDEAETVPEESQTVSDEAETTPEESETVSDEVPEEAETAPEEAETVPDSAETVPQEAETVPEEAETVPEEAETTPEESETVSDEAETTPEEAETTPEEAETAPQEAQAAETTTEGADEPSGESVSEEVSASAEDKTSSDSAPLEPIYAQAGPKAVLNGIQHEYQGWNNCGPATLGMQLSFFGRPDKQVDTAPFLKPDPGDKNVSPDEMIAYAHSIGYGGQVVVGMDLEMLRTFTANGLPIIVESWFIPDPDDEMGHYLLLTGYEGDTLTFYDSYNGPGVQEQADEFDELWKVFNRTALVVWPPEKEELASAILGDLTDSQVMYERALATAHAEVKANPQDKYAWFNLGSNLTVLGDISNAVKAFDTARSLELPWRMLWYQFGPYQAYFENGQYQEVIALTTTTLDSSDNLEESYYWRGRAQAALGEIDAARSDLEKVISLNKNFMPAQSALDELP